MPDVDPLYTFAELAITMVGVSGIVAVFRGHGSIHPADQFRFYMIVFVGMLATVAAFLPTWVDNFVDDAETLWQVCAGVVLAGQVTANPILVRHARVSGVFQMLWASATTPFLIVMFSLLTIAVTANLANIIAWPFGANQILYEVVLMTAILQMALQFLSLVAFRIENEMPPQIKG
ncbi:MAG: hypothetical protein AAF525_05995 [Pseudomonadota bacterium]